MTRNYSSTAVATTLSSGINSSTTTIPVAATTGLPAAPFILNIDSELVLVTAVAGLNLTATRGYDSTSAASHSAGAAVTHSHAAIDFRDSRTHEDASAGVHGVAGSVLGTTDTQTVTNKNLTSATNSFPSSLATLTGTQTLTNKDLSSGTNTFPASLATDAEVTTAVNAASAIAAPIGAVVMYAPGSPAAPSGWLPCDGSAVSRATYPALFTLLGTTFGVGDGSTTFNLPNMVSKFPRGGAPSGGGGGSDTVTLSTANLPSHTHTGTTVSGGAHKHTINQSTGVGGSSFSMPKGDGAGTALSDNSVTSDGAHTHTFTTDATGSGTAVTVTNPYVILRFIIRAA